ncbi:MAG TPA: hypothetical protein VN419_12605 [Humidesulfovibrio sp.]|uniref:hypothetical protein n=1 Tax=Humidesulfovibrio sp. TaxID=2910988 RepID=UPI002CEF978F|nr:hypothetical protein [Humidesulfovibrio sp.]HWR04838.1 hypothetical protein [Humidesulfovibrio sp.]
MDLAITITGHRCDLALHPISPSSAGTIERLGRKLYAKKYLEWWRQGRTSTCGVKYDGICSIDALVGGDTVPFDTSAIADSAMLFANRHYIDTKVQYLALLGYDDEFCKTHWKWRNVARFEPQKLGFVVHRWDQLLGAQDYLIIEDIIYDGRHADEEACGKSRGFNLVDPKIIDLKEVRKGLGVQLPFVPGYQRISQLS